MRMRTLRLAILGTIALQASAAENAVERFTVMRSERDSVCQEAHALLEPITITPADFWNGKWREAFGTIAWVHGTWPTITAANIQEDVPFKHLEADIDSDGAPDVAVVRSGMIRSVQFDWLYLFEPSTFRSARESGGISAALEQASPKQTGLKRPWQLNPINLVVFSNGGDAIPVELELWKREHEMLLLLKEYNFARAGKRDTNTFVVAKIDKSLSASTSGNDASTLRPAMICRFVQQ
jgi:hypothetical protein